MSDYDYYLPEMIRRAMENKKLLEDEARLRDSMSREQFYRQCKTMIFSVPRRHGKTRAIMDNYRYDNGDIIIFPTMEIMRHVCQHDYPNEDIQGLTYEMLLSEAEQSFHCKPKLCGVVYVDELFLCRDTVENVLSNILQAYEPKFIVALGTA